MTAQDFSSLATVTSVVLFLLALIMHCVEWAADRKTKGEVAVPARSRALVGVGAPGAELVDGADLGAGLPEEQHLTQGTSRIEGLAQGPGPVTEMVPGSGNVPRTSNRTELAGRLGVLFTIFALACSIAGVTARGIAAHRWPLGNMYEFTTMAMVIIVAVYLVLAKLGMRWLGLPVTLLATIGNGLAVTVFYVAVAPLVPALHSVWFVIHITAASISGAAFNIGGAISVLYLIKKRAERRGTVKGYLARLPEARRMDVVAYRLLAFAFPLWTFTIAAGAIWAEYAWGRYWGWDPKEVWALVTWVIYACYLHARSTAGWKGTRATVIAVIGLASFWFNFIGVNLLFSGLHSYAGI